MPRTCGSEETCPRVQWRGLIARQVCLTGRVEAKVKISLDKETYDLMLDAVASPWQLQ